MNLAHPTPGVLMFMWRAASKFKREKKVVCFLSWGHSAKKEKKIENKKIIVPRSISSKHWSRCKVPVPALVGAGDTVGMCVTAFEKGTL